MTRVLLLIATVLLSGCASTSPLTMSAAHPQSLTEELQSGFWEIVPSRNRLWYEFKENHQCQLSVHSKEHDVLLRTRCVWSVHDEDGLQGNLSVTLEGVPFESFVMLEGDQLRIPGRHERFVRHNVEPVSR